MIHVFLTKETIGYRPPAAGMERWFAMEIPYDKQESSHTVALTLWSNGVEQLCWQTAGSDSVTSITSGAGSADSQQK
jgi:hypothetical protein